VMLAVVDSADTIAVSERYGARRFGTIVVAARGGCCCPKEGRHAIRSPRAPSMADDYARHALAARRARGDPPGRSPMRRDCLRTSRRSAWPISVPLTG
jgi:hypothetical protein